MTNIGQKIKRIREIRNLTQDYMASKLNITQAAYSSIESGKTKIDDNKLKSIAQILDVDEDIIKNFDDKVIFNSCVQSGYINTNHINPIEKIQELYDKLLKEKDSKIALLENMLKQQNKNQY